LFGSAMALQVIDDKTFILAIGVISVSMLITPLLVRISDLVVMRLDTGHDGEAHRYPTDREEVGKRVVIGGYGRVGHTVAVLLHTSGVPFIVFDVRPDRVAQGKKDGFPVYFGDISQPDLLDAADVERASLVVLTIDNGPTALRAIAHIRNAYPHLQVISRARDLEACGHLVQAGAIHAFPEILESSLRLGAIALQMLDIPRDDVDLLMRGVRNDNYDLVKDDG
ncbi:MAG: NAD-binding protein, partial [Candidatus Thiodiazotropha sp.]